MSRAKDSRLVALVVAMESELQHVLEAVGSVYEKRNGIWLDRHATVAGVPVVAVRSGMGLINAAAATERVINAHRPRVVLNYGCAGAHRRDIMPGDVIIGTCVVHHSAVQFLATDEERYVGFGYEVGGERIEVSEIACDPALVRAAHEAAADHVPAPWPQNLHWPVTVPYRAPFIHTGAIASADVWTQSPARLDLLYRRHGSLCEDMEAAAVAQVCALHSVPFLTVKDISNNEFHAATDITAGFTNFPRAEAGRRAAALILRLIKRLAAASSS
jgi:adenosylhomocysteine nucleosidase